MRWLFALMLCVAAGSAYAGERAYAMGFTPFPYDATLPAMRETGRFIGEHADLLAVHLEHVPWAQCLQGKPLHPAMLSDWTGKRQMRRPGMKLYLALTPINVGRSGMALARGEKEGEPLPRELQGKAFSDPAVIRAYLAYCRNAVEFFEPDYLSIGIEVNELFHNNRAAWSGYVVLHQQVYQELKKEHPKLPIFVSFTLHNMVNPAWRDREQMRQAFDQLMPTDDVIAVSFYPFMAGYSGRTGEALTWLEKMMLRGGKPLAIAETGELGADVRIGGMTLRGTPELQAQYTRELLAFCQKRNTLFATWFLPRDYDAMWKRIGRSSPEAFAAWMHCGMLDAEGAARPALAVWDQYRAQ